MWSGKKKKQQNKEKKQQEQKICVTQVHPIEDCVVQSPNYNNNLDKFMRTAFNTKDTLEIEETSFTISYFFSRTPFNKMRAAGLSSTKTSLLKIIHICGVSADPRNSPGGYVFFIWF